MKKFSMRSVIVGIVTLIWLLACGQNEIRSQVAAESGGAASRIESRQADIWSDGTRLSVDLWYPNPDKPEMTNDK